MTFGVGCRTVQRAEQQNAESSEHSEGTPAEGSDAIGEATMSADGTLVLDLRAQSGSTTGDARLVYPPSHPQYQKILEHLSPIATGQRKLVSPW